MRTQRHLSSKMDAVCANYESLRPQSQDCKIKNNICCSPRRVDMGPMIDFFVELDLKLDINFDRYWFNIYLFFSSRVSVSSAVEDRTAEKTHMCEKKSTLLRIEKIDIKVHVASMYI